MNKKQIAKIIEMFKEKTAKECYKGELFEEDEQDKLSVLDDKLGGQPYLPVGEKYPVDKDGKPMALLLQVNLKNIKLKDFPKEGILEVFTNMAWPLEHCIKIFKEGLEYQTEFPEVKFFFEDEEVPYFVKKPLFIKFEKTIMHPPLSNRKFDKAVKDIVEELFESKFASRDELEEFCGGYDKYWDLKGEIYKSFNASLHVNIGGYADFCQEDISKRGQHCLFCISSVGIEDYVEIVDSGNIFGFVTKKQLKEQDFKDAVVDYDFC